MSVYSDANAIVVAESILDSAEAGHEIAATTESLLLSSGMPCSEEGLVDYVKEKMSSLMNKFQTSVNAVYAKLSGGDQELKSKIAKARQTGDASGLPIGKVGSVIAGLGALAGAAAAAALGAKLVGSAGNVDAKQIREEAKRKTTEFINKVRGKKEIAPQELAQLSSGLSSTLKRNLSAFGRHMDNHKGKYAAAAVTTAAVTHAATYGVNKYRTSLAHFQANPDEVRFGHTAEQTARREAVNEAKWDARLGKVKAKKTAQNAVNNVRNRFSGED